MPLHYLGKTTKKKIGSFITDFDFPLRDSIVRSEKNQYYG